MTVMQLMYGNPVMNVKGICEQFHISDRTARKHMKEIESEVKKMNDKKEKKPSKITVSDVGLVFSIITLIIVIISNFALK